MFVAVRSAALFLTGLLAGSALANYLLESSLNDSVTFDIEYKQLVIRAYTVTLPVLALGGVLSAVATLYLARADRRVVWLVTAAIACLAAGLVITLTIHFPINDKVVTWNPAAPPADAAQLFGRWRTANTIRTALAIAGFALLLAGSAVQAPLRRANGR
jgi:hypothetical protein